jgi:hypothetical protein
LLHDHQTRSAAEEDFIGGGLCNPRPGHRVEDRQQGVGLLGGGVGIAPQLRHAGRTLLEKRQQQAAGDGQADAFGLRRGGEAGEVIGIEDDGLLELAAQAVALRTEAVVVLGKGLQVVAVVGAVHGLKDAGSVAVEGLPRSAGEGGLSGDGAVGTVADGSGVGDAELGR